MVRPVIRRVRLSYFIETPINAQDIAPWATVYLMFCERGDTKQKQLLLANNRFDDCLMYGGLESQQLLMRFGTKNIGPSLPSIYGEMTGFFDR